MTLVVCDFVKLLWHGSRLSNVVGILSKGLRIAPPEAPSNGYMFGKGVRSTRQLVPFDLTTRTRSDHLMFL